MSEHANGCRTANCGGCFVMPDVGTQWLSPHGILYEVYRIGPFRGDGTDVYMRRVKGTALARSRSRRESARYFTNAFVPRFDGKA